MLDLTQVGCVAKDLKNGECDGCGMDLNNKCFSLFNNIPALDILTNDKKEYRDTYDTLDVAFKNELYNMPRINSLLDNWSNQIKDAVLEANQKYGEKEPSLQQWIDNINILKFSIEQSLN